MSSELKVPDIGDFKDVEIIEILVKEGQKISKNDPLITLESDKSSVEVPSSVDGTIKKLNVKIGDKVSQGSIIGLIDGDGDSNQTKIEEKSNEPNQINSTQTSESQNFITVPDIGDFKNVEIIEVLAKEGDQINKGDPIITLESDKSSVEVPSTQSGTINKINVKVGDKVAEGQKLAIVEAMKMQHEIFSEVEGDVVDVRIVSDQQVSVNDLMIEIVEENVGDEENA